MTTELAPVSLSNPDGTLTVGQVRAVRVERLLAGTRRDLASALDAQARGWTTWHQDKPIAEAIASYRATVEAYEAILAGGR